MTNVQNREVFNAIQSADLDRLALLLQQGGDPNAINEESGECCLSIAAHNGELPIVEILLQMGAIPDGVGGVGIPLAEASAEGHCEVVDALLLADAEVDVVDEDGVTPLGYAAAAGQLTAVLTLLEAGANPRHKDREGNVPASYAIDNDRTEILRILLPLSTPSIQLRLTLRSEFVAQSHSKDYLFSLFDAVRRGCTVTVVECFESGILPDVLSSEDGGTALMLAANKGHLDLVKYLVKIGANVNRTDVYGRCPLACAGNGGHANTWDYLFPLTSSRLARQAEKYKSAAISRGQWKT